jgi:hypothetical protein
MIRKHESPDVRLVIRGEYNRNSLALHLPSYTEHHLAPWRTSTPGPNLP